MLSGVGSTLPSRIQVAMVVTSMLIGVTASHVVGWLTRQSRLARTVTIKVRYDDFTTVTRSNSAER